MQVHPEPLVVETSQLAGRVLEAGESSRNSSGCDSETNRQTLSPPSLQLPFTNNILAVQVMSVMGFSMKACILNGVDKVQHWLGKDRLASG